MLSSVRLSFSGNPRRGIALLVTVILLAFLVLILVGTASLVRVETQVAENTQSLAQARQNALVGLNVAVGELQRHAGPDARITARADIIDPTDASLTQRYLTGVWHQEGGLRNWLVSGNEAVPTLGNSSDANPTVNPRSGTNATAAISPDPLRTFTVAGADAALLVGAGSAGTTDSNLYVAAQKTAIAGLKPDGTTGTVGRYAYWVGDDGIKADISLNDPSRLASSAVTPASWGIYNATYGRDQMRARAFERVGIPALFPSADALNTQWASVIDRNQVNFVTTTTGAAEVTTAERQLRFHDFAVGTAGVLSDVTNDTLRRDVTAGSGTGGVVAEFDQYASSSAFANFTTQDPPGPDEDWVHPRARAYAGQNTLVGPVVSDLKLTASVVVGNGPVGPVPVNWEYQIQVALANPYNAELWAYNDKKILPDLPHVPVRYRLRIWGLPVIHAASNYRLSGEDGSGGLVNDVAFNMNTGEGIMGAWDPDGDNAHAATTLTFDTVDTTLKPGEVMVFSLDAGAAISLSDLDGVSGNDAYYVNMPLVMGTSGEVISVGGGTVNNDDTGPNIERFTLTRNFPPPPAPASGRFFKYQLYALWPNVLNPSQPTDYDEKPIGGVHTVAIGTQGVDTATDPWTSTVYLNLGTTLAHKGWQNTDVRGTAPESLPAAAGGVDLSMRLDSSAATVNKVGATNNGYWGNNPANPSRVVLFDLPRAELASVGEFRHALRNGRPAWDFGNAGDPDNRVFDRFFCSTVPASMTAPDVADGVPLPSPHMMVYKEPGVAINPSFNSELHNPNNSAYRLMMRAPFNLNSTSVAAWTAVLSSAAGHSLAVYDPVVQSGSITTGGHNKRVLARSRMAWPYYPGGNNPERERSNLLSLFPRFNQAPGYGYFDLSELSGTGNPDSAMGSPNPMPYLRSEWTMGARELRPFFEDERDITEEMTPSQQMGIIEQIAISIVTQIRIRTEPFLSLEDFIDSRIIERAIESTGPVNWSYPGGVGAPAIGGAATSNGLNYIYTGGSWRLIDSAAPAFLLQSDIIAALAAFATVRSDTFTVRAYGESLNPTDITKIEGRAWLEAVVQRVPTPAAPPTLAAGYSSAEYLNPPSMNVGGTMVAYGRKFKIVSMRWLSKDDI